MMGLRTYRWVIALICILAGRFYAYAQPPNDDPCNAIALPVNSGCVYAQYTNVNATASAGVPAPGCANYQGADVWFSAVVPANGQIIFDSNTGTMLNGAMAVYTGTCSSLTLVACNNNGSTNGLMPALSLNGLTPGSTIFIRFWGPGIANEGTFSICAKSVAPCNPANANSGCNLADPFCAGATTNLCNTTNVSSLGGGGIYGCLGSTPNPAFYYMNIATAGPIDLQIVQQTNTGVGIDVDFVCWGPFASQAAMCAGLSAGIIIDCSYSTAAIENLNIPNAQVGEWYMVLITNYSNLNGVIQIDQTNSADPGAGSTNCNLITASPDVCTGSTFTLNGTVQTANPPASGTLTVTTSCGGSVVINAPFASTINYSIPGLSGCGQSCTVNASFSAAGAPTLLPATYISSNCNQFTAVAGACSGGTYVLSGTLTTGCMPLTGTLTITNSCGGSVVLNAPFTNPINWSLPASSGNGGNCTVTAVFSASGAPVINPIVYTEPTCCGTSVGTQTLTLTGGTQTLLASGVRQVILCQGGSFTLNSDNNFTLPSAGCGLCTPGLMYAIYSSAGPTGPDPDVDPNWTGYYWTGSDFPGTSTGGYNSNTAGNCSPLFSFSSVAGYSTMNPLNNTFVFVPITADAINFPTHDNNLDGCFQIGAGVSVTFLNPITFNSSNSCSGGMTIEINGGYPEFFTGTYTLTNTGAGTLSSTVVSSGGNVVVSGLTPGQTVSFTVTDGNGCTATFSKVFTSSPIPAVSILPVNTTICEGSCVALTGTVTSNVPAGNSTFSNTICEVIPDAGIGGGNNGNINAGTWASSSINISDFCGSNWATGQYIQVCINIAHTYDSDLNIFLQAPNGVLLSLSSDDGNAGNNFTNTCFTGTAANVIGTGGNNAAPFSGTYAPDGAGGFGVFNGTPINGVWHLWVADDAGGDIGNLLSWTISFANQNNYTYTWSPLTGLSAGNVLNPNACPTSTTTYSLTATNSCGCSTTATTTVTVNPIPNASIAGSTTICSGDNTNINFTGTPNATLSYTVNGGPNQTIVLDASGNATLNTGPLSTNTTYALVNASFPGPPVCGQSVSGSATVTVNSLVATFTYATPFCSNGSNPLPAFTGGGVAGIFSSTPGLNFVNTSTGEINLAGSTPGTYTITNTIAASGSCPQVSATYTITINAAPNAGINGSVTLCSNGSAVNLFTYLGGTPQNTGSWTGPSALAGGNLGTFTPGVSTAGVYTYTVTGTAPCVNATATVTVTVNQVAVAGSNGSVTLCSNGSAVNLFTYLGGTPQNTGSWTGPSALAGGNLGTFTPGVSTAGVYTYTVTGTAPCVNATATVTVTVNPAADAGGNGTLNICSSGSPVNLFGLLTGTPNTGGIWSGPSVLSGGSSGTFDPLVNTAGVYTYTVNGTTPCLNVSSTVTVSFNTPTVTNVIYTGSPYCSNFAGSALPLITGITGGSFNSIPAGLNLNSTSGSITPSLSTPGTYTVNYTVPASGGCASFTVSTTVVINLQPAAPVLTPANPCSGSTVLFTASGGSLYEFFLNGVSQGVPSATNTVNLGPLNAGDVICVNTYPPIPFNFDGLINEPQWGNALSTSSGGPVSGFGAGNNLDALYLKNQSGYLFGALASNLVNNSNNRLLLFIDCQAGGYNNLGAWVSRSNAPYWSIENLSNSITFDAGFTPEYILGMNQASGNTFFDLYHMPGNVNNFLGDGNTSLLLGFTGNAGSGDFTKGFEFAIPLTALGNPTGSIKVFAMIVNDPGFGVPTTLSNQFLSAAGSAELNYGNGLVNFQLNIPNPISYSLSADCYGQSCVTAVNQVIPTFNPISAICNGDPSPLLPTTSNNGISGTWSPSVISNTSSGTYTFTPNAGQCAQTININVTVQPNPTISPVFHD